MYLCFDDVRQAASAIDEVLMARNHWETEFVSFNEYSQGAGHFFDGQVIFTAEFVGQISQVDTEDAHFAVQNAINKFGDVLAQSEIGQSSNKMQYRVEYYQISSAHKAIAELSGQTPRVQNVRYNNSIIHLVLQLTLPQDWIITAKEMEDPIEAVVKAKLSFSNLKKSDEVIHSPSGRTAWTQGENGEPVLEKSNLNSSMAVALRRPMMPPPHNKSWHSNGSPTYHRHGNQWLMSSADIYIDDIEQGVDVRTTIMLRNIPNSWTYLDLKERIDPFVFGRYDFSYLRFDFGSSTNVGYGFINLLEASDIIPLYRGLIEQFWVQKPGGAWSGKKAHLSYATMQGIDTLIDKFRNSAIMDEFHGFCPKMWYTDRDVNDWETGTESSNTSNSQLTMYGGPHIITRSMVGTCRPFPPPDNETKHRRSNNNATTMGLYPPLHLRGPDGPYRGGSNFDWGTTHQMMDDFRNQFGGGGFPNGAFFVPMPPQIMAGYGGFANNQYPHGQPPRNQFHQNQYLHHGGNGYGGNGYGKNYHNSSGNGYSNNNYHHHGGSVQYGNNYQHHNGYDNAANHYQQSGGRGRRGGRGGRGRGGRGGPRGGFVSNDARVPRTFDYDGQSMDGQNTGGFNELGGKIYST